MGKGSKLRGAACVLSAALAINALPLSQAVSSTSASAEIVMGDISKDGSIDSMDLALLRQLVNGGGSFDLEQETAGDVNGDGTLDGSDIRLMQDYVLGRDVVFSAPPVIETYETRYYAVEAEFDSTSWIETTNTGYEGAGYVNYNNAVGTYVTWTVEVAEDGYYQVDFRHANGTDANRIVEITVNGGSDSYYLDFNGTGAWTTWATNSIVLELKAGTNTITATATTENGGPNMDYIELAKTDEEPAKPAVTERYYAVEAEYYKSWEESSNAGFAGTGYVNYNNVIGGYVEWTVNAPEAGNYLVDFRYANGVAVNRPVKLIVNGDKENGLYMDFNGTGAWTTWSDNTVVLTLKEGENTIKAYATTANGGPNMDYIELTQTGDAAAAVTKATQGKRVENLNRGVSAANTGNGVLVSWRHLATDNENTTFDLWKNGQEKLGTFTMDDPSNFLDAAGTATDWYTIDTFVNGEMTEYAQASRNLTTRSTGQSGAYFDIPLTKPAGGTTPDGVAYTYSANDATVGDVDGDGEYEIILKWDPSNSKDNANNGYTGNVYIDCYKLNGTRLWRIDLGKNIRAGAHYTQMMVYDYDGDGKAELVCKTADGTVDGQGTVIGDGSKDYRNSAGRILEGPEYLTVFEGATGKAMDTIDFQCARGNVADWGDDWGNRCDRFTAATAYLDGKTPSIIMNRGYYAKTTSTAYNYRNGQLELVWAFDTGSNSSAAGYHDGNHSSMPADVDQDGKDEIVLGSAVIDDNGTLLYTSGLGHGDAFHIGDLDPDNPGIEIFQCHEGEGFGISLRDGETGNLIFREEGGGDTGRCLAGNFIASNPGSEYVGIHNNIVYNSKMEQVCTWADVTKWNQNSLCYWTGALERGVMDRLMVDQHGTGRVFTGEASYNNGSKSNVSLSADIFGDWREEIIAPANDSAVLRVFGTTFETDYAIFTLMHDPHYRAQVASENVGYNQPPHTSFYLGSEYVLPEEPDVWTVD